MSTDTLTLIQARDLIAESRDLPELLCALHAVRAGLTTEDLQCLLDLADLPIFGGSPPASTWGVWSWDEQSLLVGAGWNDTWGVWSWDEQSLLIGAGWDWEIVDRVAQEARP